MWHSKAGDQPSLLESQRERVTRFPTSPSLPDGAICIWARPQGGLQPGPYPVAHLSEKGKQGAPGQAKSRGWRRTRVCRWGLKGACLSSPWLPSHAVCPTPGSSTVRPHPVSPGLPSLCHGGPHLLRHLHHSCGQIPRWGFQSSRGELLPNLWEEGFPTHVHPTPKWVPLLAPWALLLRYLGLSSWISAMPQSSG